jgi:hypothetical protein
MPINEPIKNRKVAPASLAFEGQSNARGAIFQVGTTPDGPTYQEVVNNYYFNISLTLVTNQIMEANNDKLMTAMTNAERRSKEQVGDYKHTLQWDLKQNQVYRFNMHNNVAFNSEILRTVGARSIGTPVDGSARWEFICPEHCAGSWWFHSHLNIRHQSNDQIYEGRLGFMINNMLFRYVDLVDQNMMGENLIRDMHLSGGCHVPLKTGDVFTVVYYPVSHNIGFNTATYPTSVYGYVSGHRENCEDFTPFNAPSTGAQYAFDHNA